MRFITTIMLGLAITVAGHAQNTGNVKHHEFYVGVGAFNDNQIFSIAGDFLGAVFTFGQAVKPDNYWILTPSVGYRYWFNNKVGIGAHFAFDKNSLKALHYQEPNTKSGEEWRIHNRYFYTMALDLSVNYVNKPTYQLYGNIGAGASLIQFSDNKTTNPDERLEQVPFFNMHISPLGIRFGKTIGGFAEVGWGYKGFINAGISVKL